MSIEIYELLASSLIASIQRITDLLNYYNSFFVAAKFNYIFPDEISVLYRSVTVVSSFSVGDDVHSIQNAHKNAIRRRSFAIRRYLRSH